jgi:CRISPR/Cas system-associated exonuclease Cas4 (RecB family)
LKHTALVCNSYAGFRTEIRAFLERHRNGEVVLLGASRGTADDVVWSVAPGGLIGAHRFTLAQYAAILAAPVLADRGLKIANRFAAEAVAARVVHELRTRAAWKYFGPVASTPGFAHALAATLDEMRLNGIGPAQLRKGGTPGQDLAAALRLYTEQLEAGSLADLAGLYDIAIAEAKGDGHRLIGLPLLLLDTAPRSELARKFVSALAARSPGVLACTLAADKDGTEFFRKLLRVEVSTAPDEAQPTTVGRVRTAIFISTRPESAEVDDTLDYFSAPGEAMECVEIARRIVRAAGSGVPFDRMAVLLRAPERYQPLLEEALRRANVPAHFTRGVMRPDPGGRAFLALLDCALENFSASRFAEYLSLGQVPSPGQRAEPSPASDDEIQTALRGSALEEPTAQIDQDDSGDDSDPVIAGTLQAPLQWEHLLIDAAVIGGASRWERRLDALGNELRLKLERAEGNAADQAHYERELIRLDNLQAFALPLITRLGNLPKSASWGEWLESLRELARASLRRPSSVFAVLDELEPMADVGPVSLEEVFIVLSDRLRFLRTEPPLRRGGRVFVASIEEARGRVFHTVFVPGLAEGVFPRKVAEDPLLLDAHRPPVSPELITNRQRRQHERLLLSIAVAAAEKQFTFSYPRVDLAQSRPRVPSFYALEVIRAAYGFLPELRTFQEGAAQRAPSRLDRPAPVEFADAIDDAEYDLVALDRALGPRGRQQLGAMAYLTQVSEPLGRSLRARYSRWEIRTKWTPYDGLVNSDSELGAVLRNFRLSARPYSPTALQAFAACPYRFALLGMHGLRPRDTIQPLNQMDPLTRGAVFHHAQREFFERAAAAGLLPVQPSSLHSFRDLLDAALNDTAEHFHDKLAPAIARVWRAEIEDIRTDLHGWLQQIASSSEWVPEHYELGFGLRDSEGRDPSSNAEPVVLDSGAKLRGAIDLVERHVSRGTLRVVDHKTGKPPDRRTPIVAGGISLQPLLYALAAEKRLGAAVESGRLFFCTQRGNYQIVEVPVTTDTRLRIERVLEIIDRAIAAGNLPAAPARDACGTCDCRCVCGPHEQTRWARKTVTLDELVELRNMP